MISLDLFKKYSPTLHYPKKLPREKLSGQEVPTDQNIVIAKPRKKQKNLRYAGPDPTLSCLGLVHCTGGSDEIMLLKNRRCGCGLLAR